MDSSSVEEDELRAAQEAFRSPFKLVHHCTPVTNDRDEGTQPLVTRKRCRAIRDAE